MGYVVRASAGIRGAGVEPAVDIAGLMSSGIPAPTRAGLRWLAGHHRRPHPAPAPTGLSSGLDRLIEKLPAVHQRIFMYELARFTVRWDCCKAAFPGHRHGHGPWLAQRRLRARLDQACDRVRGQSLSTALELNHL